jgi:uncharacterized membrane protein YcaP (DUF421 family)
MSAGSQSPLRATHERAFRSAAAGMHLIIAFGKLHWPLVGMISDGTPVVLYSNGRWARGEMKRLRVQEQDVYAEMRQNGYKTIEEVETATIEHNGALTILQKSNSASAPISL